MPLQTGQVLQNRYRIDALLGQGGMGAVYRAWDTRLNMSVAIKENLDASPAAQSQFGNEAHILANLSHPNLTRVTDYFFIAGQGQYLVMDYVEGEDLENMAHRRGFIPINEVLTWITQICDAVTFLHRQNPPIIHRDIKPANIKVRSNGAAILVDFGIAKIFDKQMATTMGAKAVTPGYSPPEQYGGSSTDPRSDVYALGATLYRLVTGQVLPESVTRAVSSSTILFPRQLNPQIPPNMEAAILRAVDISADRRFQSVQEFRTALNTPASVPVFQPIQPVQQVQPTMRAEPPTYPPVYPAPNQVYQQPVSSPPSYQSTPANPAAVYNQYQPTPQSVPPPSYSPSQGSQPSGYPQGSSQPPVYYPPLGPVYPVNPPPPERPKWLLWAGIGSVALIAIAVLVILFSNGTLGGSKDTHTPTPRSTKKVSLTLTATTTPMPEATATFTATAGPTETETPVPTETPTPTATPPDILGKWSLFYTWGCEGNGGVEVATFLADNRFTTGGQWYGTYTYDGTNIAFTFANGTRYTGVVSNNLMKGTMVDMNGNTGCWDAKPYGR